MFSNDCQRAPWATGSEIERGVGEQGRPKESTGGASGMPARAGPWIGLSLTGAMRRDQKLVRSSPRSPRSPFLRADSAEARRLYFSMIVVRLPIVLNMFAASLMIWDLELKSLISNVVVLATSMQFQSTATACYSRPIGSSGN